MPKISPDKVEEIIQAADIVDVISEYVALQPAGKSMKGLCPFHSEKTPSFSVSKERQIFNCFGCGEKGGVVQFISKYKHLDYWESLKFLADKYRITIDNDDFIQAQDTSKRYFQINDLAKQFYNLQLLNLETGKTALEYLKSRGFDELTLNNFEVGYAPKKRDALWENLSKNYHDYELVNLGLIQKRANDYSDVFNNRIMFPIKNEQGRVVGFSGRIFSKDDSGAKYVNSAQTETFKKSDVLYNLNRAIPVINQSKRIVLMEGFFDVISAYQAGVSEAVCSMGTALTLNQAQLIKKYTDNVVVCYDGDEAGIKAAYKALLLLSQVGLEVKIALMPNGMDPDDYIQKESKTGFRNILKNQLLDQYDFVYEILVSRKDLSKPIEIEKAKLALFDFLDRNASSTIREIYLKKFGVDTSVNYEDILADYHSFQIDNAKLKNIQKQKVVKSVESKPQITNKAYEKAMKQLINYFAVFEEARDIIESKIDHIRFENKRYQEFLLVLVMLYKNNRIINEVEINKEFADLTDEELLLFRPRKNAVYNEKELNDCIETLMINKYDFEAKQLFEEIRSGMYSGVELENKQRRFQELQNYKIIIRRNRNVKKTNN
jgi:DNA primase